jgi:hypothetical protein
MNDIARNINHITINLDALLNELGSALQLNMTLYSVAMHAQLDHLQALPRFQVDNVGFQFAQALEWTPEQALAKHRQWALKNAMRDAVEGAVNFIESAHLVLSIWKITGAAAGDGREVVVPVEDWRQAIEVAPSRFNRCTLPDKFKMLAEDHGVAVDPVLEAQLRSINQLRNCLVHRGGVVGTKDLDNGTEVFEVRWRTMEFLIDEGDGPAPVEFGKTLEKGGNLCIRISDKSRTFQLGEAIELSEIEFAGMMFGLFAFGTDLVQKVSAVGVALGVVSPKPSTVDTEDGQSPSDS